MRDLSTPADAAILLIDHQVGTLKLAPSTPRDEIVRNTRALARAAVQTGMPLVLTSSQEERFQDSSWTPCSSSHRRRTPPACGAPAWWTAGRTRRSATRCSPPDERS